jgi:hypothetical protein
MDGLDVALKETADVQQFVGGHAWHHRQRFGALAACLALAAGDVDAAAEVAAGVISDSKIRGGTSRYESFARLTIAHCRLAAGAAVDHEEADAVLAELDRCAGLEVWRLTAKLAADSGVDRWWRDAERRAGALIANAGEHGEGLRRYVVSTFAALGRS